jgi:ankyrin repeat protein
MAPLHCAASGNSAAAIDFLMAQGVDVHCKDAHGRDALVIAALHGRILAMERLLHHGANVLAGANGQDALFRALVTLQWNAAVYLLAHGANEHGVASFIGSDPHYIVVAIKRTISRGLEMRVKVARFRRSSITDISKTIADVPSKSGFSKVPVLTHIVAEYAGYSIVEALQLLEP